MLGAVILSSAGLQESNLTILQTTEEDAFVQFHKPLKL